MLKAFSLDLFLTINLILNRKTLHKTILLFSCIILLGCNFEYDKLKQSEQKSDSISLWIKYSKKTSLSLVERKLFLNKSYNAIANKTDSSSISTLSKVAYQYLKLKDTPRFKEVNNQAYKLALVHKDTFTLADVHWNNANYYKKIEAYEKAYYHYNKAYNYFESIGLQYYAAKMLYGMSFIKGRFREYAGSEKLILKAISKYKKLKKNKALYASYNHLALLQYDIKEYDKALFYHKKALEYVSKLKDKEDFTATSLNNIGIVYIDKREYLNALNNFNKVLEDEDLKNKNINHYARVVDNRAYCKLLYKDTIDVKRDLYESLIIRTNLNNMAGITISKIHLSEYYSFIKDSLRAISYAREANALSKKIKNSRDYLASLILLSNLDKKNAAIYLEKHITFNDSLQDVNRKTQNKFTRIAYETDEYIEETKQLSQQKVWLLVICLTLLFILSLIYYIQKQKAKSEKLVLETAQQKADEQVYILTLRQQAKLEEEKTKERNRISEELHDGILGKLFGIRVDMGFLELKGSDDTLKKHESFLKELQHIEKEIREVSHKLSFNFSNAKINFNTLIVQLLKNKGEIGDFTYSLQLSEAVLWENIDEVIKVNVYRIIQEALQNIIKYAKATDVIIRFSLEQENLVVTIKDNGIGLDVKKKTKGIGVKNMKSRIEKLKGNFNIDSKISKGTAIYLKIPIHYGN